ncbi:MAG: helix-turn-helix domain-containing protein [Leptolyngbyaceae cyanobacterium bins.59]|nr:helix-turn-helix domain-containing protein [Leptolyngbyaceae cyanobacterium bins.59]
MFAQTKHCLSSAPLGEPTLTSQSWETIVQQVEQVLYNSATYQQTIGRLGIGETSQEIHNLLQTTIREAIHLTLNHSEIGSRIQEALPAKPPTIPRATQSKERARKSAKVDGGSSEREVYLREVGATLQATRQAQSLSLDELHQKTWVPVYQIRALEMGQFDRLPEDIYVRGFVRRLGNALGLKGNEMAAAIPSPASQEGLVPCWSRPQTNQGFYLRTTHLYVGYLTLMAGALGGLSWISHQSVPQPELRSEPEASRISISSRQQSENQVKKSPAQVKSINIAPPETMLFAH